MITWFRTTRKYKICFLFKISSTNVECERFKTEKMNVTVKNRKNECHHWISQIQISLSTNFWLKLTVCAKYMSKKLLPVENKKSEHHHWILHSFCLNGQFWFSGPNLPESGISGRKHKSDHHYWILHVQINLGTKFQFKLTISIFWTDLPKNSISS